MEIMDTYNQEQLRKMQWLELDNWPLYVAPLPVRALHRNRTAAGSIPARDLKLHLSQLFSG